MNLVPLENEWRPGKIRFCCPICPYDSPDRGDVVHHISAKHPNEQMPDLPVVVISHVPLSVTPEDFGGESLPKITCVMLTKNRRNFVERSIAYFKAQTYPNRELVIVDDGEPVSDLESEQDNIRVVMTKVKVIGEKRNIGCKEATGEIIALWDDDEWQSPNRLAMQYKALISSPCSVVGTRAPLYGDEETKKVYAWNGLVPFKHWLSGSTMMFKKAVWASHRFPAIHISEDSAWLQPQSPSTVFAMAESGFNVSLVHNRNTVRKDLTRAPFVELALEFPAL